ncbi:hypothetical protein RhiirA4_489494 [Rhizophagus irregularis]|uniref:Uncharacterized protein n=1 Tax=Rhizophagus irregularis TaxID=588596 RepID=A0A2I1HUU8_9GLOM|nr:hypothetical protein RhiirA4_489494 [Rhizophagus irregularis]
MKKNQQYEFFCKDGCFILKCHHQKRYKPDHAGILFGEESSFCKVSSSTSKKTMSQVSSAVSSDLRDYPEFQKKILEGYFLNIKAHFLLKTHDYLRDLPPAIESFAVKKDRLSPYIMKLVENLYEG